MKGLRYNPHFGSAVINIPYMERLQPCPPKRTDIPSRAESGEATEKELFAESNRNARGCMFLLSKLRTAHPEGHS